MMHRPSVAEIDPPVQGRAASKGLNITTFRSLKHRDFRLLFFTIMFTSGGQWMQQIALSWMAYSMTDSAFMLGAINGMRAIPFLVLGPWAGVAADRMDRKMLMMVSQAWIMGLAIIMTLLIVTNLIQVWHLFAFTLLSGAGWSFTQPVRQTLVPNLVPREDLTNAIALQSSAFNLTRVIGPTIAGILLATVGPAGAFGCQAALYIFILAVTAMINVPPLAERLAGGPNAGRALLDGFAYIGKNEVVLWLIILALIPMMFAMPLQSLMPVFARDVLDSGPEGYGIIVSFMGIGALTGTLIVASLTTFQRKGLLLLISASALGIAIILFSQSTLMPLSLFLLLFVGGFQMTYMSLNNTLLHLNITDEFRGRVISIYMLDQGLSPIGALFAGTIASFFGAPLAVSVMGLVCVGLAVVALVRVPRIRQLA